MSKLKGKNIKLLVLDVDGVLTDDGMYYTESGDEFKRFNAKDGLGIITLIRSGKTDVAMLSSGIHSNIIKRRAERLGITRYHTGLEPKTDILENWRKELGLKYSQIAYCGNDINDLGVIKLCGLTFCPADAVPKIKKAVDVILKTKGGEGCVRELIERFFMEV